MRATVHPRQEERLAVLRSYGVLDTPRESDFDEIVALAAAICDAPIAVVNLIDGDRQWFKAEVGLGVRETPLESSLCSHAILENDFLEVRDTLADDRMCDNPLCLAEGGLRFYAGALLKTASGLPIGTLCILDTKPRQLSQLQVQALMTLSRQVMAQLDLRLSLSRQRLLLKESDHRVKNSLQSIVSMMRVTASRTPVGDGRDALRQAMDRISNVSLLHEQLYLSEEEGAVDAAVYVTGLVELLRETAPPDVAITLRCEPIMLDARQARAIGVIVTEFVSNSIKHAFASRPGTIAISLERTANGLAILTCGDDGPGLKPAASEPAADAGVNGTGQPPPRPRRGGLGMRIMSAAADNLGGSLDIPAQASGHGISVTFSA